MTEGLVKQSIAELRDFARCRRYMVDAVQVVADRIEELEAKLVTKKTCPLGEDCDLTVAWMAGRKSAKDEAQAMVAAALEEAAAVGDYFADMDYAAMHYPEEGGLAASGTAHEIRQQIRAMIPDAGAALDRALAKARAEEREAFQDLLLEAATDLESYIESDWPADLRSQYPSYQAKWKRDMDIVNRIRARVTELKEETHD